VNLEIRLSRSATDINLCWARMKGHGSSSVIRLLLRSMADSDDRFADSTKMRGSMDLMPLLFKISVFSRCRLLNTPSCQQYNNQNQHTHISFLADR